MVSEKGGGGSSSVPQHHGTTIMLQESLFQVTEPWPGSRIDGERPAGRGFRREGSEELLDERARGRGEEGLLTEDAGGRGEEAGTSGRGRKAHWPRVPEGGMAAD